MDLESLRIFVKVAELGSITQAASQLRLSKASVSVRLRTLEEALNCQLFHRTTRLIRLSAQGEELLPRARRLVAEADEIDTMFLDARALQGRVSVDLPVHLACHQVLPRLSELLERYPKLDLLISGTDRQVEPVREGFDCVVRVGALGDANAVCRRLGALSVVNCASPGYLRHYGTPLCLADLDRHYVVHYQPGLQGARPVFEYRHADRVCEKPMRTLVTVTSTEAYTAAALSGLGIIQAPRMGLLELLADGALQEVLPELTCAPMPVFLLHTHGRRVPQRVRVVLDWLAQLLAPFLSPVEQVEGEV